MEQKKHKRTSNLRKGEQKRPNGTFAYRWSDEIGKRHTIYAESLEDLRAKEEEVAKERLDGIKTEARFITINDMYEVWKQVKRGLKDNTFQNYQYLYTMYVEPRFGQKRITDIKKSDMKRFYNTLVDERALAINTVDGVHNVVHQVLQLAVDDELLRNNPSDNVLKELKLSRGLGQEQKKALTREQQELFLSYMKEHKVYKRWYPVFAVMVGTGMRVGEAMGLRWCDIDLNEGMISINHTLIYYRHGNQTCYHNIHTPKTKKGIRKIPMLDFVKEAFLLERKNQLEQGIVCKDRIDGYTDFIFLNRVGKVYTHELLNRALKRIQRDCNDEVFLTSNKRNPTLLPPFSCHILRHTFATRLCEAGVNIKVIQDVLGHSDISTTLNIYTDVTKQFKKKEFSDLNQWFDS